MRLASHWVWRSIAVHIHLTAVYGLGQFENIAVVKSFADSLLDPATALQQNGTNVFSAGVQGNIDILTTSSGNELATQYIYGPFAAALASPSTPSLFGRPVSYNVTGLTVLHSTVSASIVFDLQYDLLNLTVPLRVDGWFNINNQHRIDQFDLTFNHWSWAMDTLLPALSPHMAATLGLAETTDSLVVLRQYLTMATCMAATMGCTGSNAQYASMAGCLTGMSNKTIGSWDRMADDTLLCRAVTSQLVSYDPSLHCPELGVTGASFCRTRSYLDAAETTLPESWNAAKYITPENKHVVGDMQFVSVTPLSGLLEVSLAENEKHSWDLHLYAAATFGYFLFYYFFAKGLWLLLRKTNGVFRSIQHTHQKNVVMYAMNIIFTFLALALELLASPAFGAHYELWGVRCLKGSAITISSLYIFELIFRFDMRLPLTVHHVLTIVAISYAVVMFEWSQDPGFAVSGIVWLFQATTEQPTFVGLMGYRLEWDRGRVAKILKFSAIQTFIIKSASAVGLLVYWAKTQNTTARAMDVAWSALVFVIAVGLLLTQIWGSYVTYIIGVRIGRKRPSPVPHGSEELGLNTVGKEADSGASSMTKCGGAMGDDGNEGMSVLPSLSYAQLLPYGEHAESVESIGTAK